MDKNDIGEQEAWFSGQLPETIIMPGSMASNDKGDTINLETKWMGGMRNPNWVEDPNYAPYFDPEDVRLPYWLQPYRKYTGAAWYQKEIRIPNSWNSNQIKIHFERVHWESTLWFDDQMIGMRNSLGTSHEYIIKDLATPGKHMITVRVDNRMKELDVGWDSHSVSDHTQSNWNGIVGELSISPVPQVSIGAVKIFPKIEDKSILVSGEIMNTQIQGTTAEVIGKVFVKEDRNTVETRSSKKGDDISALASENIELQLIEGANSFEIRIPLGDDALLWDEFNPNLYTLELSAQSGKNKDKVSETFGLRKIEANENGIFVNKRPTFLRGTLECAIFPLTGYPSTNPDEWKRIMLVIKNHGLNHMRFHSWCPPEAAFIAADEMGVYLQVECSSWANSTSALGNGDPIDQFIWDESKWIIEKYGNHPSFVMLAYGNEPAGVNQGMFLTEFVSYWKENDHRRIYTSGAGWPKLPVNDYHNVPQPRIQGWGEQLNSIINAQPPSSNYDWTSRIDNPYFSETETSQTQDLESKDEVSTARELQIPTVSHEIGQWCVYPNLKEKAKYTGVLKARNFEIFEESLNAHQMNHLADSFLLASGKLQALCYKADIEAALRTPNFGGFQLLDLHDFPGQGTALVGVLDPFWEEKGYISPEEFSSFCNTTVPLARLNKHIYLEGETLEVPIQIALFEKEAKTKQTLRIRLLDLKGETVDEKSINDLNIPLGNKNFVGSYYYTFKDQKLARQLELEISLGEFSNSWNIWVYPKSPEELNSGEEDLSQGDWTCKIRSQLSPELLQYISEGGTALLSLGKGRISHEWGGQVGVGFSSIFWNTAWTAGQKPHTLGILCNPNHPALADFPTSYHSDWQWWDAMAHADAIQLDKLGSSFDPIVRIIDDWVTNRPLALILEARLGNGKIIISGADLHSNLDSRPSAMQLRRSLINYMASDKFAPTLSLSKSELTHMIL